MTEGTPAKIPDATAYRDLEAGWPGAIAYAALGALLLWVFSLVAPRQYRAEAIVLVHHNVERVVEDPSSDEAALYIDRETAVLEGLTYADVVWEEVAQRLSDEGWIQSPGDSERLLQDVRLPHPKDGEWRFTATTRDPALSARVADLWAETFVAEANRAVSAAVAQESLADRIVQETATVVAAQNRCMDLDSAWAQASAVDARLEAADPAQAALETEGLLLSRLATQISVTSAAPTSATVADQRVQSQAVLESLVVLSESCRSEREQLEALLERHRDEASSLASTQMGLSPLLEIALLRGADVPTAPVTRPEAALGIGGIVGICVWVLRKLMGDRAPAQDHRNR